MSKGSRHLLSVLLVEVKKKRKEKFIIIIIGKWPSLCNSSVSLVKLTEEGVHGVLRQPTPSSHFQELCQCKELLGKTEISLKRKHELCSEYFNRNLGSS